MNKTIIYTLIILFTSIHLFSRETAFTTDFDAAEAYQENFVAMPIKGEADLFWSEFSQGFGLRKTGPGTVNVILDDSAMGGKEGHAGVSGNGKNAGYKNVEVCANVRFADLYAGSLGLWVRVSPDYSSGYLGLINILYGNKVRFRIFGLGSTPMNVTPGKLLKDVTINSPIEISPNELYRASFSVQSTDEGTTFCLEIRDRLIGSVLASTSTIVTSYEGVEQGQVGFRVSSGVLIVDDFTISLY